MDSILGSFPNLNDFLILWFCPKDTRIRVSILLLQTRGGCSQQPSSLHTSRGLRGKLKAGREVRAQEHSAGGSRCLRTRGLCTHLKSSSGCSCSKAQLSSSVLS